MNDPDIRKKAEKDRNWLQEKLRRIPGFHGYLEKEERRNTDRLLREHLAERIEKLRRRLDPIMRDLTDSGGFEGMEVVEEIDRLKKALERLGARIRYASYGYSGVFDAVKVREEELDRLYAFDAVLVERVEDLETTLEEMGESIDSTAEPKEAVDRALFLARELDEYFDRRTELITTNPEQ